MFFYVISFIISLCAIHILFNYNDRARLIRKLPGPRDDFIIGNALNILLSPVEMMKFGRENASRWNGIYRLWIFPFGSVIIYNPQDVETIMSGMNHTEKGMIYDYLKPWLRDGLLVSKGAKWQARRKILTPAFHFNILRQFCEVIVENSQRLVESLALSAGQQIDVAPVLSEFTLNSICETAMGTHLNDAVSAGKSYKELLYKLSYILYQRLVRVHLFFDFIYYFTSLGKEQNKCLKVVQGFTEKVINDRRRCFEEQGLGDAVEGNNENSVYKKKRRAAMLDLLISAEKDRLIDKEDIQEEVDTFMFEGHDTTASGLTFCFMSLATNRDVQDKVKTELMEIFGDSKRAITMEDLSKMRYIECCIKESLRLNPPVHFISRNLSETTVLSGYTVPAGTMCHIPIYDLHHSEDLFPNPEQFDPDRFLPENSVGRHPYAYIPFSAGPRNCIGQKFAMMEMKVAVAEVLRQFELVPVTRPEDIVHVADLVLRNDGPILVKFLKRNLSNDV